MSAPTRDGGKPNVQQGSYSPPQGPKGINNPQSPGLHGDHHNKGLTGSNERMSGSPGIGGTNYGNCGSQRK